MGLMDRDYYREKKPAEESIWEKLKKNPLAVIALVLVVLFVVALML